MKEILLHLDKHLLASRPDYFVRLAAPLPDDVVTALEAEYNTILPEDLKALYRWKNGQQPSCSESFVNNSIFMPLEDVFSSAKELNELIPEFKGENWWRKDWLPIFHNGGGDHICYDTAGTFTGQAKQLIEFWHADSDRNVIAPELATFLKGLIRYYETTRAEKFDSYFNVKEEPGFPKNFEA